ncbi:MAG: hypothetical protein Kow0074_10080 [Candidatus Zixiibacteriota bacterium]
MMRDTGKPTERRRRKTEYHVYSLQSLQSEKFIKLLEKVLRQEYYLFR